MKSVFNIVLLILIISGNTLHSQTQKVQQYLRLVAQGKLDEVKVQMPDLLAAYPDDPGVMLLHGVVIEDGYRALDIYKEILKSFPDSEWADDAYWRIIQFYAITGDTTRAKVELENFRKKYPASEFLTPAVDVVRTAVTYARRDGRGTAATRVDIAKQEELQLQKKDVASKFEPPFTQDEPQKIEPPRTEHKKTEHSVETESIKKQSEESDQGSTYGLQVGIFSTREAAQNEMKRFLAQRMRTEIREKNVDGDLMYAVVVGDYTSKASAEAAKTIVQQQCKCNPIVFKK